MPKGTRRSASDRATVTESRPISTGGGTVAAVPELSEQRRDDALRAITYQQLHVRPMPLGDVRLVLDQLGLTVPERSDHRAVACPSCGAPAGSVCRTSEDAAYTRGHLARHKAAEEGR
jgi:hypothetical protein